MEKVGTESTIGVDGPRVPDLKVEALVLALLDRPEIVLFA